MFLRGIGACRFAITSHGLVRPVWKHAPRKLTRVQGNLWYCFFCNVCFCLALSLSLSLSPSISHCYSLSLSCPSCPVCPRPVCRFKKKTPPYVPSTRPRVPADDHVSGTCGSHWAYSPVREHGLTASHGSAQNQSRQGQQALPRRVVSERHNGGQRLHQNVAKPHALHWAAKAEPRGTSPTSSPRKCRTTTTACTAKPADGR